MNAWQPQASYPCGNFSDTSSVMPSRAKGSIGPVAPRAFAARPDYILRLWRAPPTSSLWTALSVRAWLRIAQSREVSLPSAGRYACCCAGVAASRGTRGALRVSPQFDGVAPRARARPTRRTLRGTSGPVVPATVKHLPTLSQCFRSLYSYWKSESSGLFPF